jgi:hypothetical protein
MRIDEIFRLVLVAALAAVTAALATAQESDPPMREAARNREGLTIIFASSAAF